MTLWGVLLVFGVVGAVPAIVGAGTLLVDHQALRDAMTNAATAVLNPRVGNQISALYLTGVARDLGVAPRSLALERFQVSQHATPNGPSREVQTTVVWWPALPVPVLREAVTASVTMSEVTRR